ncbi:MAG TPA: PspC domain-containing protein [Clostridiales bacterium]|nr:PspC domain-containing protein [Clostridiales bacterium]
MEKRLFRSKTQRILGGVCGGMAEYFNVDVTLVRLIWIIVSIALLAVGGGILIYIIAWIIIPEAKTCTQAKDYTTGGENTGCTPQPEATGTDTAKHQPHGRQATDRVNAQDTDSGQVDGPESDDEADSDMAAQDTDTATDIPAQDINGGHSQDEGEDTQSGLPRQPGGVKETKNNGPVVAGIILIIIGIFVIIRKYMAPLWLLRFVSWENIWPILLIAIGLAIVVRGFSKRK